MRVLIISNIFIFDFSLWNSHFIIKQHQNSKTDNAKGIQSKCFINKKAKLIVKFHKSFCVIFLITIADSFKHEIRWSFISGISNRALFRNFLFKIQNSKCSVFKLFCVSCQKSEHGHWKERRNSSDVSVRQQIHMLVTNCLL